MYRDDHRPSGLRFAAFFVSFLLSVGSAMSAEPIVDAKTKPSPKPMVSNITLDEASDTGLSQLDRYTRDNTPTLIGRGTRGATISVREGAAVVGTARVAANGSWVVTTRRLADGAHSLVAVAKLGQNESRHSKPLTITIDTRGPAIPTVDLAPASDNGTSPTDNVTTVRSPTLLGIAQPGTVLEIVEGTRVPKSLGVPGSGRWTAVLPAQSLGRHTYVPRAVDKAGNTTVGKSLSITYVAPTASTPWWSYDLAGVDGTNGARFEAADPDFNPLTQSASVGDVNNDGFDDIAIGGVDLLNQKAYAYIVFGKDTPFSPMQSALSAGAFRIDGSFPGASVGMTVVGAGDVNADGFDDILIGVPGKVNIQNNWGRAFVIFGAESGPPEIVDLENISPEQGFSITVPAEWTEYFGGLGSAVAGLGDFDGDGIDDFAVGAPFSTLDSQCSLNNDDCAGSRGSVFVIFGRAEGYGGAVDLSTLDGASGFRVAGFASRSPSISNLGQVIDSADLNGDGYMDLVVGSSRLPDGVDDEVAIGETAFVIFGRESVPSVYSISALDGETGFRVDGRTPSTNFGKSIASLGDFDGDGFGDLGFGISSASSWGHDLNGSVRILFGKSAGFEPTVLIGDLTGADGLKIDGPVDGSFIGERLAGIGDSNGDGIDDIAISAESYRLHAAGGAVYVLHGRANRSDVRLSAFSGADGVRFTEAASGSGFPYANLSFAGDVDGDGSGDLLIGVFGPSPMPRSSIFLVSSGKW